MANRYSSEILAVVTALEWDDAPSVSTLRLALFGGLYVDPDNPLGAAVHYQGAIKSDVVFKKKIGIEFWKESSDIDFGYLDIALENQADDLISFGKNVTVCSVKFYRVNLSDPSQDQLEIMAAARSADIGFADEFTMRIRMESILQNGFDGPINALYYDYEYPQLQNKPYPIAWGRITDPQQLIPTITVDETILLYHITDIEIDSFETFVYDKGVQLTQPTQFEPAPYGFTLNQNPAGRLTSGEVLLNDPYDPANYLHGLYRMVRLVMKRTNIWQYVNQAELAQLESDIDMGDYFPQFFTFNVVSVERFLDKILSGVTGWYYVDELTEVHFGRMVDPDAQSALPFAFTDASVTGRIRVEDDKAAGLSSSLSYAYNAGAYSDDELAGSVILNNDRYIVTASGYMLTEYWTADDDSWTVDDMVHTADGFASQRWVSGLSSYWVRAQTIEPVQIALGYSDGSPSAFDLAEAEVQRWWSELYYKRRRFYTFTVELNDDQFETTLPQLGDFCTLQSDRFKLLTNPKNLFIRKMDFNYSRNQLTLTGWG